MMFGVSNNYTKLLERYGLKWIPASMAIGALIPILFFPSENIIGLIFISAIVFPFLVWFSIIPVMIAESLIWMVFSLFKRPHYKGAWGAPIYITIAFSMPLILAFYICYDTEYSKKQTKYSKKQTNFESQPIEYRLAKYVYVDDNDIYHIDPSCYKLKRGKDSKGHDIYAKHLIDTTEFVIEAPKHFRVCTRCVSDDNHDNLQRISRHNLIIKARLWLYDKLVEANFDMPDYDTYTKSLSDFDIRSRLYEIAQEEHWNVGKSVDEFSKLLGF